jgi:hypothetical protein
VLHGRSVRLIQRRGGFLLHGRRGCALLKSANSDHNQRRDNPKYNNERDGRDNCPARPEETIHRTGQRGNVFIILRRRPLTVGTRIAHFFAFSPSSTSRRMASGLDGNGCFCLAIHSSRPANIGGCMRTTTGSPLPVAGGPRLFCGITVCFFMIP